MVRFPKLIITEPFELVPPFNALTIAGVRTGLFGIVGTVEVVVTGVGGVPVDLTENVELDDLGVVTDVGIGVAGWGIEAASIAGGQRSWQHKTSPVVATARTDL